MRRRVAVGNPAHGVHEFLAQGRDAVRVGIVDAHLLAALLQCCLDGLEKSPGVLFRNFEAIDDKLHRMVLIAVKLHSGDNLANLAVDAHAEVTFLRQLFEKVAVMALAVLYEGRENADFSVCGINSPNEDNANSVTETSQRLSVILDIKVEGSRASPLIVFFE